MFASTTLQSVLLHQHHHLVIRAGMRARSALQCAMFSKLLRVSKAARDSTASVVSLQQADSNVVMRVFWFVNHAWAAPLQTAIAIALLYQQLGWPALVGAAAMASLVPAQKRVARSLQSLNRAAMVHADARVKLVSELVSVSAPAPAIRTEAHTPAVHRASA